MLILVRGSMKIDPKNIQDISVGKSAGRNEVLIKHITEKMQKENVHSLTNPRTPYSTGEVDQLASDLKSIVDNPNMPLSDFVNTYLWGTGNAAARLNFESGIAPIALANLCWFWRFGQNPSARQIELRTTFHANQAKTVALSATYTAAIRDLVMENYSKSEFVKWHNSYSAIDRRFGERMRISPTLAQDMFASIAEEYGVTLAGKPKPQDQGPYEYKVTWGRYNEPDSRKYNLFGELTFNSASLNRAKQMATSRFTDWLDESLADTASEAIENQKIMSEGYKTNKGRWLDGKNNSSKTIGEKDGNWSGLFLRVARVEGG